MPIQSIISQPVSGSLHAAYRPIVLRVAATRADGNAVAPVVFCDIYVNDVYYKSLSRTHYDKLNVGNNTEFEFDLSDAAQEVLRNEIPVNGGGSIIQTSNVLKSCYCKFRSSGFDTNGYITTDGTSPVQGTGSQAPVSGTGTQSTTFYIVNAALQHEDNQDLQQHLNSYKLGTWDPESFPLSHRPDRYKICAGDSDYFPVIYLGPTTLRCIRIKYKLKSAPNTLVTRQSCQGHCGISVTDVAIVANTITDIIKDEENEDVIDETTDPIEGEGSATAASYTATFTTVNGPANSYVYEYSLDGGTTWNEVTLIAEVDGSILYSIPGETAPVDHLLQITPMCGIAGLPTELNTGTPGQGTYTVVTPPVVTGIILRNEISLPQIRLTRFFKDGTNIFVSSTPIYPGQEREIDVTDITNPHTYGTRVFANDIGSPTYNILARFSVERSGLEIAFKEFNLNDIDVNLDAAMIAQAGDKFILKDGI